MTVIADLRAASSGRRGGWRRGLSSRPASRSRSWLASLAVIGLLATTGACGAPSARQDLAQALEDTRAAVRSAGLAVDLLQRGQTTSAAAEVTARDMADQIGQAQQQLVTVPGPTAELRSLREQAELVITEAQVAVQDTEDIVAAGEDPAEVAARLAAVDQAVERVVAAVGER